MGRFEMDREGVSAVGAALRHDPDVLRGVADRVAAAGAPPPGGVGAEAIGLGAELDRFRLVHAGLVDAVADAFAALGGDLGVAVGSDRATELAAVSALGALAGAVPRPGGSGDTS
jgi:hypothetical protein